MIVPESRTVTIEVARQETVLKKFEIKLPAYARQVQEDGTLYLRLDKKEGFPFTISRIWVGNSGEIRLRQDLRITLSNDEADLFSGSKEGYRSDEGQFNKAWYHAQSIFQRVNPEDRYEITIKNEFAKLQDAESAGKEDTKSE